MQKTKARKQGVSQAQMEVLRRMHEEHFHLRKLPASTLWRGYLNGYAMFVDFYANGATVNVLMRKGLITATEPTSHLSAAGRALVEVSRGTK